MGAAMRWNDTDPGATRRWDAVAGDSHMRHHGARPRLPILDVRRCRLHLKCPTKIWVLRNSSL